MRAWCKLVVVSLKLYVREPAPAFFTLAFPSLLVLLFGAIYGNEPNPLFGGNGSMDIAMPGYTAMVLCTVGLMQVPIQLATFRETGVLRRLRVTSLRPIVYILADVTANLIMGLLSMVGFVLLGWLLYRVQFRGNLGAVVLAALLSALAMFSLGYLIASVAPSARSAMVIGMVVFYPMLFLSGAAMPSEILPAGVRNAARFLPLTHVVHLLRGVWFGAPWSDHYRETAILAGIFVICAALSTRLFRWE